MNAKKNFKQTQASAAEGGDGKTPSMRYSQASLTEKLQIMHYLNYLLPYLYELTQPQLLGICVVFQCGQQKSSREVLINNIMQAVDAAPLMSVQLNIKLPALQTESDLDMLLRDCDSQD